MVHLVSLSTAETACAVTSKGRLILAAPALPIPLQGSDLPSDLAIQPGGTTGSRPRLALPQANSSMIQNLQMPLPVSLAAAQTSVAAPIAHEPVTARSVAVCEEPVVHIQQSSPEKGLSLGLEPLTFAGPSETQKPAGCDSEQHGLYVVEPVTQLSPTEVTPASLNIVDNFSPASESQTSNATCIVADTAGGVLFNYEVDIWGQPIKREPANLSPAQAQSVLPQSQADPTAQVPSKTPLPEQPGNPWQLFVVPKMPLWEEWVQPLIPQLKPEPAFASSPKSA